MGKAGVPPLLVVPDPLVAPAALGLGLKLPNPAPAVVVLVEAVVLYVLEIAGSTK